jgi:hypothetical protein
VTALTQEERVAMVLDRSLRLGSKVTVHWTFDGRRFHGPGLITKVNPKSVVVGLTDNIGEAADGWIYHVGHQITVPRFGHGHHSENNRVTARHP